MNYYVSQEALNGRPCRGVIHVVKAGDTLYKLSRIYDVQVSDLIWHNPGVRIYQLQIGDRLCIPIRPAPPENDGEENGSTETFPYVVRDGEDLDQLLSMFRMTWDELKALNPEVSPSYVPGTVLSIPTDRILR